MDFKKQLIVKLKAKGLDVAEDFAHILTEAVFETAEDVIKATPNKVDDMFLPVLGIVKPQVLKLVDKIDGKEG